MSKSTRQYSSSSVSSLDYSVTPPESPGKRFVTIKYIDTGSPSPTKTSDMDTENDDRPGSGFFSRIPRLTFGDSDSKDKDPPSPPPENDAQEPVTVTRVEHFVEGDTRTEVQTTETTSPDGNKTTVTRKVQTTTTEQHQKQTLPDQDATDGRPVETDFITPVLVSGSRASRPKGELNVTAGGVPGQQSRSEDDSDSGSPGASAKRGLSKDQIDHVWDTKLTSEELKERVHNGGFLVRDGEMAAGASWYNRGEEICKSELGADEYGKRLDRQTKAFEAGCKKGGLFDSIPMWFKKSGIKSQFESLTKSSGRRPINREGAGALGYVQFEHNEHIPDNEFFQPGRMLEVRARHSNFPNHNDDAQIGWRGVALKFSDHDYESPFDLILQTGRISPFCNAEAVEMFFTAMYKNNNALKAALLQYPIFIEALLEGVRKMPDSYYHQRYYSQMTYDFEAKDEVRRVSRFRLVPDDGSRESGRLSPEEQREAWYSLLLERDQTDDGIPDDYLQTELKKRVDESGVSYRLQMQIHEWQDMDSNMLYNPSVAWDESEHPWHDLATVRLTNVLPSDVTEVTRYNIGNLPTDTLSIPEASSTMDFNSVPAIRQELYELTSKLRAKQYAEAEPNLGPDSVEYLLHVVTGASSNAGNMDQKCNIYACLIGTEGRTSFIKLNRKTKGDFDKSNRTTFTIRGMYIGEFQCIKLFKEKKGKKSEWFLEYVVVSTPYNNKCHTMPCYRWFTDETPIIVLRDGNGLLASQEEDYYIRRLRQHEITNRQQLFHWRGVDDDPDFEGLPGYISAGSDVTLLPIDLQAGEAKRMDTEWTKHLSGKNSFLKMIRSTFKSRKGKVGVEFEEAVADSLPEDKKFLPLQHILRTWREDTEFGRQMLNGVLPTKIHKLDEMPANFPVTDRMLIGQLTKGRSLRDELQEGRLFFISYPELAEHARLQMEVRTPAQQQPSQAVSQEDLAAASTNANADGKSSKKKDKKSKEKKPKKIDPREKPRYLCAPKVLLLQRENGDLVPLAIQLTQIPSDPQLIFTKNDDNGEYSDWLVAKMWVRVAEANVHQYVGHILGSHLLMEPVLIALARNLPAVHPVHKLLIPHLRDIVTINTLYRKHVISEEGALNEVMAIGAIGKNSGSHIEFIQGEWVKNYKYSALLLPAELEQRGVLGEGVLPNYYYRDDAMKLWEAIQDYVGEVLCCYYEDDEEAAKDEEITAMLRDLGVNGYHYNMEMPDRFSSLKELVVFCTAIIFRCSVQHSAVSKGMVDIYSYCLNAPPCMMKPPPFGKNIEGYTEEDMKELLPPPEMAERYIGAQCLLFGGYDNPKIVLGAATQRLYTEEKPLIAAKNFQDKLKQISAEIRKRNEGLDCPYDYLLPERIPNGIDI